MPASGRFSGSSERVHCPLSIAKGKPAVPAAGVGVGNATSRRELRGDRLASSIVITKPQIRAAAAAVTTVLSVTIGAGPAAADVGGGPQPEGPYCARIEKSVSCTVVEPVVTQRATTYPIVVHRGDRIMVTAGGCVQTGGHGLTWKRYLAPESGNDLYHGLIDIPGVT